VHEAAHTSGYTWVTSVLGGNAKSEAAGMIRIAGSARGTSAHFTHDTLLLSEEARGKTSPALEIETNEVKASHSATVSHLDDNILLYLKSRGIGERDAERLVITSFAHRHMKEVPEGVVREECARLIEEKVAKF
jgi:Fe-S cluster assembly scaffold protein SufB